MTLTELSYHVRRLLPFAILSCLIFLILFYSVKLFFLVIESNQPTTIATNPAFGKITGPILEQATSSAGLKLILDTVEGQPVTASDTGKVFFLPKSATRFGYREKIYMMAKSFGFDTERVVHRLVENDTRALFDDGQKTLTIDISNFNFEFNQRFDASLSASIETTIPSKKEIENKTIDFLKKVDRYPDELGRGKTNIIYLRYDQPLNDFVNVSRASEAKMVEVDFYRPDIDGTSTVSPKFFNSQNYLIVMFEGFNIRVLKGRIAFFEKSEEQVGVYPLKTGDTAWQELTSGQGIVVAGTSGTSKVVIKKMFLGYLDPDIYQNYIEPVYVFVGDNDFVSYIPAVSNDYLIK